MSNNFHNLHVRTEDDAAVADVIARWLAAQGFEPVKRDLDADRTVRISRARKGWVTILDDGYEISTLARIATESTGLCAIEMYCEASAIVAMTLHRAGECVGGWGREIDAPNEESDREPTHDEHVIQEPSREDVDALGVRGLDAAALSAAWRDAIREIFPESAIAVAAKALGLDPARVFENRSFRGHTLRLRRTTATWTPAFALGPMALDVYPYAPDALFVDRDIAMQIAVQSLGGAGHGLEVRFGPQDLLALEKITLRDGREFPIDESGTAHVDVAIAASLTETPDLGRMTRREADRAQELSAAATTYLMLHARTLRTGEGALAIAVGESRATCALSVFPQPYRPLRALPLWDAPEHDRRFFGMHYRAVRFATLCFAGTFADAWAWSRPHVTRLDISFVAEEAREGLWHLVSGTQVVAQDRDRAIARLDALTREPGPLPWVSLSAPRATFGNESVDIAERYEGETPVIALTLVVDPSRDDERASLVAILDDAMRRGIALSALMGSWEHAPRGGATIWENLTTTSTLALSFRSWHAERVRGMDHEGVWLGPTHLARVQLDALPPHADVTRLCDDDGALVAARIGLSREHPRSSLRAIEDVLDPVLPSAEAIQAWDAAHPGRWR